MAGTTSNTHGRIRLIDNAALVNRWLETLGKRTSPQLPDITPVTLTDPDRGFIDFIRYNTWKVAAVAAGASSVAQVIWPYPSGKVLSITVQTLGTAGLVLYDNASAASGNALYTLPPSAAVGTYQVNSGVTLGITAGRVLNSPAVTVTYCEV